MYGCEISPYRFSVFPPIIIFSLEFIEWILDLDHVHFVGKKEVIFKIKAQVGPFVVNSRATNKEVDFLLAQLKFSFGISWSYDPIGRMSSIIVKKNFTPYVHLSNPNIEKYVNNDTWEEGILE